MTHSPVRNSPSQELLCAAAGPAQQSCRRRLGLDDAPEGEVDAWRGHARAPGQRVHPVRLRAPRPPRHAAPASSGSATHAGMSTNIALDPPKVDQHGVRPSRLNRLRPVLEVRCTPHDTEPRLHVAAHDQQVAGAQRRAPLDDGVRVPAQHKVALRAKRGGPCAARRSLV